MPATAAAIIERVEAAAYAVPTEQPETDGTLAWDSTTLVLVRVAAGGEQGIGYSDADGAAAVRVRERLAGLIVGRDALQTGARWAEMVAAVRNGWLAPDLSRPGLGLDFKQRDAQEYAL